MTSNACVLPGVTVGGWFFSLHALERCSEMSLDLAHILRVVLNPVITYPGPPHHGPGRRISVGEGLAVVNNPSETTVITVLWDGKEGRESCSSSRA